jgi:tetraprenyl-beta-curcumene synthase
VRAWTSDRAILAQTFALAAERYWLRVFPHVHREIRHWRRRASAIPDATLRTLALETLESKWGNLEGAAAFAVFAPPAKRATVARASIAWQTLYDFADTLMEQPSHTNAANARRLHSALLVAVTPGAPHGDYYAHHSRHDDHGYTTTLIDATHSTLATLPSYGAVSGLTQLNASRIIQYQALINQPSGFAAWASVETPPDTDLRWWETGAACGSSMVIFALIASAADPKLQRSEAVEIEHVYFPWIGSLHTLLDSLIDRREDITTGQHSLVGNYSSFPAAAKRMEIIAGEAVRRAQTLPHGMNHALILAGMVSLYLSSPTASLPDALPSRDRIIDAMGDLAIPTMIVLGVRRAARRVRATL